MTALMPGGGGFVPQMQASAHDGVEEALRLAGPRAGGDEGRPAGGDGADGALLVAVEMRDPLRDPLAQVGVEQVLGDQGVDRRALPERTRQADVRPLEERRTAGPVQRQERAHLRVQARVREGVGRELVAQEAPDDLLGIGDGVQGHGVCLASTPVSGGFRDGPGGSVFGKTGAVHHNRLTPYPSNTRSTETRSRWRAWAWATSMRSKGSRCGPGSLPARSAVVNGDRQCPRSPGRRCCRQCRSPSPRPPAACRCGVLVAISQAEAVLTKTSLASSAISR